jgi:16S rRNA (guanine(966)-N(2))-methyltransferase RsmD
MRVITGTARGRRLRTVPGRSTRPTSDRVKEALFAILGSRISLADTRLLDLFAGSGALGIEALSRGAGQVIFVEHNGASRRVLEQNLANCGFEERAEILFRPARQALVELERSGARVDGVFLDPPYGSGLLEEFLSELGRGAILTSRGWAMAEHPTDGPPAERYGILRLTVARRYGKTSLALYAAADSAAGEDRGT